MRLAFYLDNRGLISRGPLPDPLFGNPGIGGTEYAFWAVIRLLHDSWLRPLVLLRAPQAVDGIDQENVVVVGGLAEAVHLAALKGCCGLVFRPGFATADDWPTLETTSLPLLPWLSNLGCDHQARYEQLAAVRFWILLSGAQADALRHSHLFRKAVVIPYPVCVPAAQALPRELNLARTAKDIAYVGALTPFKGFDRLARVWPSIAKRCSESRLIVFGGADLYGDRAVDGLLTQYETYCRELLEHGGYSTRVVFEGSCGLERYQKLESVAVGVANPSGRDETFCLAAAEFSACGIPVLAPRRNVFIQTVRNHSTGLLASHDSQLADFAVKLLQNPKSAWQMGGRGQRFVQEQFSPDLVREAWLNLVRQLANGVPVSPLLPTTPWWYEWRWLRQLWGQGLRIPGWPSWPDFKQSIKRLIGCWWELKPLGVAVVSGLLALLVWALLVFGKFGGNPTGLARIGDQMVLSPRLAGQELVVLRGKRGNDGQQFLALSLDPLQADPGTAAAVDNPIYRGKRLLYPLLAWLLGLGRPGWIIWWLGWINVACIGLASGLVARWAQLEQRSPQWGFAVLALPGYWITLTLGTADLLATTLMLAAAVAWKEQRPWRGGAALAAALLSRETELLAWAATSLAALREKRWPWLLPLALAPLPLLALMGSLRQRFSGVADGALASLHFTWPLGGIAAKVGQLLLGTAELPPLERAFDGLSLLLWLASLAVLLIAALGRWRVGRWLRWAAGLYLLPALCTSTQILARFPDYTRVWIDLAGLALLALLSASSHWVRPWLLLSAAVSAGYGVGYVLVAS